jgi:hypothetical protein
LLEKKRREQGYVEEPPPPPKTPPPLGVATKPKLHALLDDPDSDLPFLTLIYTQTNTFNLAILILPVTAVKVGPWVRFGSDAPDNHDLVVYYCDARSSFTWFVQHAERAFKAEVAVDIVRAAALENTAPGAGALGFALRAPPTFSLAFRRADGTRAWRETKDWTSGGAGAAHALRLEGVAAVLAAVLRTFGRRIRSDARVGARARPGTAVDGTFGVDWVPLPPCTVPSQAFCADRPAFAFGPPPTHFGTTRIAPPAVPQIRVSRAARPAPGYAAQTQYEYRAEPATLHPHARSMVAAPSAYPPHGYPPPYAPEALGYYPAEAAGSYPTDGAGSYAQETATPYAQEAATPNAQQAATPYAQEAATPYSPEPTARYAQEALTSYAPEAATPYAPKIAMPNALELTTPYAPTQRPQWTAEAAAPYAQESATPYVSEAAAPYPPEPGASYAPPAARSHASAQQPQWNAAGYPAGSYAGQAGSSFAQAYSALSPPAAVHDPWAGTAQPVDDPGTLYASSYASDPQPADAYTYEDYVAAGGLPAEHDAPAQPLAAAAPTASSPGYVNALSGAQYADPAPAHLSAVSQQQDHEQPHQYAQHYQEYHRDQDPSRAAYTHAYYVPGQHHHADDPHLVQNTYAYPTHADTTPAPVSEALDRPLALPAVLPPVGFNAAAFSPTHPAQEHADPEAQYGYAWPAPEASPVEPPSQPAVHPDRAYAPEHAYDYAWPTHAYAAQPSEAPQAYAHPQASYAYTPAELQTPAYSMSGYSTLQGALADPYMPLAPAPQDATHGSASEAWAQYRLGWVV